MHLIFEGFAKSLYLKLKFDSDAERRFAVILEDDPAVEKWVRPPAGIPRIEYEGRPYEPDFIVQTAEGMYLCEVKGDADMGDAVVIAKANAAAKWCSLATEQAIPWAYLLVPDSRVQSSRTFDGIVAERTYPSV